MKSRPGIRLIVSKGMVLSLLLLVGAGLPGWFAAYGMVDGPETAGQNQASAIKVKDQATSRPKARLAKGHRRRHRRHHRAGVRTSHAIPTHSAPQLRRVESVRHHRHHSTAPKPVAETVAAIPPVLLPPLPLAPAWPVNDKPAAASVNWNGRDLSISADNSSLSQILSEVSTATGVKVEGASGDQRVYGKFGPAPAREVLNELLEGSGYNIMMIGDSGAGTPRELVLSARSGADMANHRGQFNARPAAADDDAEEEPEPQDRAEPVRRRPFGGNPGQQVPGQPSDEDTPQEQQQRLQQLQQQLQQGRPQVPPQQANPK